MLTTVIYFAIRNFYLQQKNELKYTQKLSVSDSSDVMDESQEARDSG